MSTSVFIGSSGECLVAKIFTELLGHAARHGPTSAVHPQGTDNPDHIRWDRREPWFIGNASDKQPNSPNEPVKP
jgi:hypothetical protein